MIDVWANDPAVVVPMANLLAKRTDYYHFVSSIAAYANYSKIAMDETAPTRTDRPGYGGNKARSEKALTDLLGDHVGICRPCAIMGPRDESLSYHYWLSHLKKDQEFVAPGTGDDAFAQYVDVRDVANWIVDCAEHARPGIYNTVSEPLVFRSFLGESAAGIDGKGKPVWWMAIICASNMLRRSITCRIGIRIGRGSNESHRPKRALPDSPLDH